MLNSSYFGKIGLIAGCGNLPIQIARYISQNDQNLTVVVFHAEYLEHYLPFTSEVGCFSVGQVGAIFNFLRAHRVSNLVFAGAVQRPDFQNISDLLKVDLVGAKLLAKIVTRKYKGDDALLSVLYDTCRSNGFEILSPLSIMPQPILNTQSPLHKSHMMNIKIGAYTLRALGKCDVGQSIVVYEQRVLGIEAAEGTDALIERCAKLRQGGVGGVMVKMMKENQNPMMDPPVIGVNTVRQMQRYGYDGIAVQKDKVIILDVHEILNQLDDRFFLNILDDTE